MQRKFFIFIVSSGTVSLVAFLLVLFRLDPCLMPGEENCEKIFNLAFILFLISLAFLLTSIFSGIGFFLRRHMSDEIYFDQISVSLRQGILLSLCAVGCLGLLFFGVLTWWSGFLLLAVMFLVELFFSAKA